MHSSRDADPAIAAARALVLGLPTLRASVHRSGMNKPRSGQEKSKGGGGGLGRVLRKQMARLCIIRECVIMLLFYHD
ncbi:hypothetical protein HU200_019053 [Digitaria exilis]|uniref:Uncharacterized protein n=3 Tax=Paniceae TaxID=147428 RepID=A0A835F3X1_9POAL|nr:hypothetical protein HU200_019053 [Digitaria exilis]